MLGLVGSWGSGPAKGQKYIGVVYSGIHPCDGGLMAEMVRGQIAELVSNAVGTPVIGCVTGLGLERAQQGEFIVPMGMWLRWRVGKNVRDVVGREGLLLCKGGHDGPWKLVRCVASRYDFTCCRCGAPGVGYMGDKPIPFQGESGEPYGTLRLVIVALGDSPGLVARQVSARSGLRLGAASACLRRCLRRGLVTATPGKLIPSGHPTRIYALSEQGQTFYKYYGGGA